ncbi:MAG: hypothetical protein HXY46_00685 [Syntrophaceae bacterium]|nr:hypothetical protein [Syntrophaceae bacterium]
MEMIKEIKESLAMEIRPMSREPEYLEAVVYKKDIELLKSILIKHLGPPAKEPGKEVNLPKEIQRIADSFGCLRIDQSFYYRQEGNRVMFAILWPWKSNPNKITLKVGIEKLFLI